MNDWRYFLAAVWTAHIHIAIYLTQTLLLPEMAADDSD
jgi:hypothetical protein